MSPATLNLSALQTALDTDPEFTLTARHLTANIRVVIGAAQSFTIVVRDGTVTGIDPVVTLFDAFDIQLAGTEEQWSGLLTAIPPAFYQDFFPAAVHHGFRIEGDMETIMAYYPAIRRLGDLFRTVADAGVMV